MNAAMGLESMMDKSMAPRPFTDKTMTGIGSVTYDDLAKAGRFGDRFLAHVADGEMVIPKQVLDNSPYIRDRIMGEMKGMGLNPAEYTVNGGDLTNVNPKTGLPEFGFFKSLKKIVKKAAKVVVPIVAGAVCGPGCAAAASGAVTKLSGGSWGDALKSAAFSYAGSSFAQGMGYGQQAGSFSQFVNDPIGQLGQAFTNLNPFSSATGAGSYWQAGGNAATGSFADPNIFTKAGSQLAQSTGLGAAQGPGIWSSPVASTGSGMPSVVQGTYEGYNQAGKAAFDQSYAKAIGQGVDHASATSQAMAAGNQANLAAAQSAGLTPTQAASQISGQGITGAAAKNAAQQTVLEQAKNMTLGDAAKAGASMLLPGLLTYQQAGEPVPESEMAKYDAQARAEIQKYNECVSSGAGNCQIPSDLKPVNWQFQTQAPVYNAPIAPVQVATNAQMPTGTNVVDLYAQFAARRPTSPSGIMRAASGGSIKGPGTGTSDSIPAMLSDGEFVMTAQAVRGAGNGSRQAGVKKMYDMMRKFEGAA